MKTCSFCGMKVGESSSESVIRHIEAALERGELTEHRDALEQHARKLRGTVGERQVKLLLPGPDDILMCNLCADLYADTARRELAAGR